jgi:hypothetical protein
VEFLAQQKLYKGFYGIAVLHLREERVHQCRRPLRPQQLGLWPYPQCHGRQAPPQGLGSGPELQAARRWPLHTLRCGTLVAYSHLGRHPTRCTGLQSNINTERLRIFTQFNARVDKRYYFKGWTLNVYFDVENALGSELPGVPFVDVVRNAAGQPTVDPADPSRYLTRIVPNDGATVIPSIGVMVEF